MDIPHVSCIIMMCIPISSQSFILRRGGDIETPAGAVILLHLAGDDRKWPFSNSFPTTLALCQWPEGRMSMTGYTVSNVSGSIGWSEEEMSMTANTLSNNTSLLSASGRGVRFCLLLPYLALSSDKFVPFPIHALCHGIFSCPLSFTIFHCPAYISPLALFLLWFVSPIHP